MRQFSETEKNIIRKLVNAENALYYSLSTVYFDVTSGIYINNEGFVCADSEDVDVMSKQIQITQITLLLHWLAENRYIWILSYELPELENRAERPYKRTSLFPLPPDILKMYKHYQSCPVFISQELVDLVKDNFKTYEERVLNTARWTLVVAVITLIASVIINI